MRNPILRRTWHAFAATLVLGLTGCDSWFEADRSDIVDPDRFSSDATLPTLRDGARGDYFFAYAGDFGGTEGIVLSSGLVADEFDNSDTFPTRREMDSRRMDPANVTINGMYRNLHRARTAADFAAARFIQVQSSDVAGLAELHSLSGLVSIHLGENFCSGVPLSRAESDGSFTYGTPLTTTEQFTVAVAKFDSALAVAPAGSAERYLAQVGKGRALLNLGQYAAAATAVAGVPTDFAYTTVHTDATDRTRNGVFGFVNQTRRFSVGVGRGGTVNFLAAADPRVPAASAGRFGFDNITPLIVQQLFPNSTAPIPIATGIEARLIEAEAALNAGQPGTWLAIHNDLRESVDLPDAADPGTADGRIALHFRERAFWLYSTAHRLGDLRRMIRQYGQPATVFPTGAYYKGGSYGTDFNIPVPIAEQNNPNIGVGDPTNTCIDRNA